MSSKRTRKAQRLIEVAAIDEELFAQEQVERDLEEEVRSLWKATRWYAGHEAFYEGRDDLDHDTWCGCDCNKWNRLALQDAIDRLRAWRARREYRA